GCETACPLLQDRNCLDVESGSALLLHLRVLDQGAVADENLGDRVGPVNIPRSEIGLNQVGLAPGAGDEENARRSEGETLLLAGGDDEENGIFDDRSGRNLNGDAAFDNGDPYVA